MKRELIRKNIKYLRKENGMTQQSLADDLHFESKSTISEFETGSKSISWDAANRIAEYFNIEYADLVSCDFAEMNKMEIGSSFFYEKINVFLPIVKSDQALKNRDFQRTVEMHEELFSIIRSQTPNSSIVREIITCGQSYTNLSRVAECSGEAVVNNLGLTLFVEFLFSAAKILLNSIDTPNVILKQMENSSSFKRYQLETIDACDKKKAEEAVDLVTSPEIQKQILGIIKEIRKFPNWRDVGDYYMAMRYAWGISGSDLTPGMSYRIGSEMLIALADVGNPYAEAVLNL